MSETSPRFYLAEEHHPENGTLLGFWLYLMSDCLVFACLFACYGVLGRNYAAGPSGAELFDLPLVALNTSLLLFSSITYGFAMLEMQRNRVRATRFADGSSTGRSDMALYRPCTASSSRRQFSHSAKCCSSR